MTLALALDLILLLGLTARLTRFVVSDSLAEWTIRAPAYRWAGWDDRYAPETPRERLVSGLECPWCVGFHVAWVSALSLALVGGPGGAGVALEVWRWVAGVFTLNYVSTHLGIRLGDAGTGTDNGEVGEGED